MQDCTPQGSEFQTPDECRDFIKRERRRWMESMRGNVSTRDDHGEDTARLDWLEVYGVDQFFRPRRVVDPENEWVRISNRGGVFSRTLREAIDKAMQAEQKGGE